MSGQPLRLCLAGFALGSLAFAPTASAATFQDTYCDNTPSAPMANTYKKSTAKAYALVGRYEGYQWGGGCWNDNNKDDSPNQTPRDETTEGEGGDCSGFTNKTWRVKAANDANKYQYVYLDVHHAEGTYTLGTTTASYSVTTDKSYSRTWDMDAFTNAGHHIGMIYAEGSSGGTDTIIEAKGEDYGTGLWSRNYRGDSSYEVATIRKNWTPECWPSCQL